MLNERQRHIPQAPVLQRPGDTPSAISAPFLFGTSRTAVIEHDGERYLLRITRNDKLILTK